MLVTCPESAHLEQIDFVDSSCGMLIQHCTAGSPECPRTCAARLDRKAQRDPLIGTVIEVRSRLRAR
jgi:hypothetical protein